MSNPTTPFGWQMPTNTDLVTDLPADFEVFGQAVATSLADLNGGTTGQVLAKASNADMDFVWSADAAGMTNPMTTTGDTIYSSSGSTPARLGIGTTGQVLTVASGIPSWATPTGAAFVGCFIYMSADVNIPNDTQYILAFDSESFDTDSFHSTSVNNSRITIPAGKAGKYLIVGSFLRQTGSAYSIMGINKNGSRISALATTEGGGTQTGFTMSKIENLNVGDYIQAYLQFGTTRDAYGGPNTTTLSLVYLGA